MGNKGTTPIDIQCPYETCYTSVVARIHQSTVPVPVSLRRPGVDTADENKENGTVTPPREFEYGDHGAATAGTRQKTSGKSKPSNAKRTAPRPAPSRRPTAPQVVYGSRQNHFSFLESDALARLLQCLGGHLSSALATCPHWFITIMDAIRASTQPILDDFKEKYGPLLELQSATISFQPLYTAESAIRMDLLLFAKISNKCIGKCLQLSYSFAYAVAPYRGGTSLDASADLPQGMTSDGRVVFPNASTYGAGTGSPSQFNCIFRFDTLKKGASRKLWIHRDICRFHGDELMVASLPDIPVACAEDCIEVPVNLANAFGVVDVSSIRWAPPVFLSIPSSRLSRTDRGRTCELERAYKLWSDLDAFQQTTTERLQENDHFHPQWEHKETQFAGIDVTCSRSTFLASSTGEVPHSFRLLGIAYFVRPEGAPVVCPLKRFGLQHDRFTQQHARQGDTVVVYVTQGGAVT